MEWYNFIAAFFSGAFIANTVPHFLHGISGNKFPTPFATPRGVGLSSSTLNVFWSLFNLAVGWLLFVNGHISQFLPLQVTSFAGLSLMALMLSKRFQSKHKE
jgi:hypothetical protein